MGIVSHADVLVHDSVEHGIVSSEQFRDRVGHSEMMIWMTEVGIARGDRMYLSSALTRLRGKIAGMGLQLSGSLRGQIDSFCDALKEPIGTRFFVQRFL